MEGSGPDHGKFLLAFFFWFSCILIGFPFNHHISKVDNVILKLKEPKKDVEDNVENTRLQHLKTTFDK